MNQHILIKSKSATIETRITHCEKNQKENFNNEECLKVQFDLLILDLMILIQLKHQQTERNSKKH